jgi:hypothetical protein
LRRLTYKIYNITDTKKIKNPHKLKIKNEIDLKEIKNNTTKKEHENVKVKKAILKHNSNPKHKFHNFISIDWSAKNTPSPKKPSKDAIWLAIAYANGNKTQSIYLRSRHECNTFLHEFIKLSIEENQKTLVGFDFAFGYPAGYCSSLGIEESWKEL